MNADLQRILQVGLRLCRSGFNPTRVRQGRTRRVDVGMHADPQHPEHLEWTASSSFPRTATPACRASAIATTSTRSTARCSTSRCRSRSQRWTGCRRCSSSTTSTASGARAAGDGLSGAWDHDERMRVMDGDGIAAEVIFPDGITEMNTPPFGAGLSLPMEERIVPELQWAGARAHNRWLAELVRDGARRGLGVALVPALWDVDEAVSEVRRGRAPRAARHPDPALWGRLPPTTTEATSRSGRPAWTSTWSSTSTPAPRRCEDAFGPAGRRRTPGLGAMGIYVSEVVWFAARPITFLIWGGVFERHPKLRVAVTESTAAAGCADYLGAARPALPRDALLGEARRLLRPPEEQAERVLPPATSPSARRACRAARPSCAGEIGLEATHVGQRLPASRRHLAEHHARRCTRPSTGCRRRTSPRCSAATPTRFYGFDRAALAPVAARIGPARADFNTTTQ